MVSWFSLTVLGSACLVVALAGPIPDYVGQNSKLANLLNTMYKSPAKKQELPGGQTKRQELPGGQTKRQELPGGQTKRQELPGVQTADDGDKTSQKRQWNVGMTCSHFSTFSDYGIGNYGSSGYATELDNCWVLDQTGGYDLSFTQFDLEDSSDCSYDWVEIWDNYHSNSQSSSNYIGRWCGDTIPTNLPSMNGPIFIWFHSDYSRGGNGFSIDYSGCNDYQYASGSLSNDIRDNCYSFYGTGMYFNFQSFNLQYSANCMTEYLAITYDGHTTRYCGNTPPPSGPYSNSVSISYHFDGNYVGRGFQFGYVSDAAGGSNGNVGGVGNIGNVGNVGNIGVTGGFGSQIILNSIGFVSGHFQNVGMVSVQGGIRFPSSITCTQISTVNPGWLSSPSWPNLYQSGRDYCVILTGNQMQLEFDTSNFHVGSYNGNTCANDYISLASGNYNPVHFCGSYAPVGPFIMNGPVTLWFHTSNMAPSTGWYMSYISYTSNGYW